jgi:hypothetical protein
MMELDDDAKKAQSPGWGTRSDCTLLEVLSLALCRQVNGHSPQEWSPKEIIDHAAEIGSWRVR